MVAMSVMVKYVAAGRYTVNPSLASPSQKRSRLALSTDPNAVIVSGAATRPWAIASWKGAPEVYVRNCLAARTAATKGAGPVTQPTFHPVNENVLPPEEIDSVRSAMPGNVAKGTCVPSKT